MPVEGTETCRVPGEEVGGGQESNFPFGSASRLRFGAG